MIEIHPTGSSYICSPPVINTDEDYVVLVPEPSGKYIEDMTSNHGWSSDTKYPGNDFTSIRRGSVNYIVTDKKGFFDKFVLATQIAKSLNLLQKNDRVTLFQGILYGKFIKSEVDQQD